MYNREHSFTAKRILPSYHDVKIRILIVLIRVQRENYVPPPSIINIRTYGDFEALWGCELHTSYSNPGFPTGSRLLKLCMCQLSGPDNLFDNPFGNPDIQQLKP